jgi:hypothetical protein
LDALEEELAKEEESGVIEAEDELTEPADAPKATAAIVQMVRAMKPVVAQIKDPAQRKQTADTLAALARFAPKPAPRGEGYAAIVAASKEHWKKTRGTGSIGEVKPGYSKSSMFMSRWASMANISGFFKSRLLCTGTTAILPFSGFLTLWGEL